MSESTAGAAESAMSPDELATQVRFLEAEVSDLRLYAAGDTATTLEITYMLTGETVEIDIPQPATSYEIDINSYFGFDVELRHQSARFSEADWAVTLRPIIDFRGGPWQLILNPQVEITPGRLASVTLVYGITCGLLFGSILWGFRALRVWLLGRPDPVELAVRSVGCR